MSGHTAEPASNVWIVKPPSSARSDDIVVSDGLAELIRATEAFGSSVVISKYITRPLTYQTRKFDLRFIVLLKSAQPLGTDSETAIFLTNCAELYVYNQFWIRLANKPFVLRDFDDYETHFTVLTNEVC